MPASIKHLTDKKLNLTSLLARWKDGLYYTAAVVKCDKVNKKCLVCFEDGSEIWINNRDVHIQLTLDQLNEDEDIVCCICDDGNSEPPNEIILCDVCQQGYHQKCHTPPVDSSKIDESEDTNDHKDWFCATCSYILNQSNRAKLSANAHKQQPQQSQSVSDKKAASDTTVALKPKPKSQSPQLQTGPQRDPSTLTKTQSQSKTQPQIQQQPLPQPIPQPQPQSQIQPQTQQQQKQQLASPPQTAHKQIAVGAVPKHSPTPQQSPPQKTTVGPIKPSVAMVQKQAPYYPLTSQVRVIATSSTAALANMTASSALVVGSSAGRTKQDLVNQSTRSAQKQRSPGSSADVIVPPVKHAVRKSCINFVTAPPAKQSALPTATRSILPSLTATTPKLPQVVVPSTPVPTTIASPSLPAANSFTRTTNTNSIVVKQPPSGQISIVSKLATWSMEQQQQAPTHQRHPSAATTSTTVSDKSGPIAPVSSVTINNGGGAAKVVASDATSNNTPTSDASNHKTESNHKP